MLRIFLFGALRLEWNGQPYPLAGLPKISSLLAYLLVHRAHPIEREQLAFTLWTDETETRARANLRRHLHDLKRALPPSLPWILSGAEIVQWNLLAPFWLDVADFESRPTPELYQGDLCANLYDDWIVPERERLRAKYVSLLEHLIETNEREQNLRIALDYTQHLARHDPLREDTYRIWMRLLAQQGDRAGVARVYNMCVTVLERELDVEPAPETQAQYAALVRQVSKPVVVTEHPSHNLPLSLTPLIGRATAGEEILARLRAPRLVTLTGTGGVGKTRLALHVAHALLPEFADGVWFLDLAEVGSGDGLVQYVAQTLEIVDKGNRPLRLVLLDSLRSRDTLLIFDNCEHIIDAVAGLAHDILAQGAHVKILATSREALRVPGEHVIAVSPLAVPSAPNGQDGDEAETAVAPSMQLLVERAQATQPTFQLTAENAPALARICRVLEGIPLALELAAARLNVLRAEELAARLESQLALLGESNRLAPARHQTLRATFDWSFDALPLSQRVLLMRLAVFDSHFSLTAAETVCGHDPLAPPQILGILSALISKSLVDVDLATTGRTQYRLLQVTRQFALERLGSAAADVRHHLLTYYVAQVEHFATFFHEPRQVEAYAWVHDEYANVRAALEFAWTLGYAQDLARLCAALWQYWWTRGNLTEGRVWLERALDVGAAIPPELRADLLNGAGRLAVLQEDPGARPLLEEHLTLRRMLGDPAGIGEALNSLGALYYRDGELASAVAVYRESLEIFQALNHTGLVARALANLGELDVLHGDLESGLARLEASRALFKQIGALRGESIALINLGTAALQANNLPRARTALGESLELKLAIQDQDGIAWIFEGLSVVAARENEWERALSLMGAALQLRTRLGTSTPPLFLPLLEQIRRDALSRLPDAQVDMLISRGQTLSPEQAVALAFA